MISGSQIGNSTELLSWAEQAGFSGWAGGGGKGQGGEAGQAMVDFSPLGSLQKPRKCVRT